MKFLPSPRGNRILWISSLVFAVLFSLGIRLIHLEKDFSTYHEFYFCENETPLMTTLDAYYHLGVAKNYLTGREKPDMTWGSPLLPLATAWLSRVTRLPLEKLAFFLPVFLASFMVLIYFCWGRELGGNGLFLTASLLGTGSFYWYMRTCLGRFDTDSLIPFFVYGISFSAYQFSKSAQWSRRMIWLVTAILLSLLFYSWWLPSRYLILPLVLAPYALSLFFMPAAGVERRLKIGMLVAGALLFIFFFFGLDRFLQGGGVFNAGRMTAFLDLVFKGKGAADSPEGPVITELLPATWDHFSKQTAGHMVLLVAGLAGFIMIIRNQRGAAVFLLVPIVLASVSFAARRFLIFMIPLYALGLAYFLEWLYNAKWFERFPRKIRLAAFICLVASVVAVNSAKAFQATIRPGLTCYHAALAKAIDKAAPPEAKIWNWWDHGFFLRFYGGRDTIIDGGNQLPDRMFVAAFPLTTNDPVLAGNWIKFFSTHGMKGLQKLDEHLDGKTSATQFLKMALASPENLKALCRRYKIGYKEKFIRFLFPDTKVYLYLEHDLFEKAYWWYYYGTSMDPDGKAVHPAARKLPSGRFSIDQARGALLEGGNRTPITDLYYFVLNPTPHVSEHKTYPNNSGPAVIWVRDLNLAYVLDQNLHHSMFTKLLLLDPVRPPAGYTAVKYAPFQGGVWRVD